MDTAHHKQRLISAKSVFMGSADATKLAEIYTWAEEKPAFF